MLQADREKLAADLLTIATWYPHTPFAAGACKKAAAAILAEGEQLHVPKVMDESVREILGKVNFWCGPIAHLFRDKYGEPIPNKSEAEQAFVIHWLLGFYDSHGVQWRQAAGDRLEELQKAYDQRAKE